MTDTPKPSLFQMFGTDRDAEENGKWFDYGGPRFKLRRFKSKHATRVRERLEKPFAGMRRNGLLPAEIMEKVIQGVLVESIIVEVADLFDDVGAAIPLAEIDEVLHKLPELRDKIVADSINMDGFRDEADANTKGN